MHSFNVLLFKIKIEMTQSLNDLKDCITKCKSITKSRGMPVQTKHQRIFFLGRELKTGSRSLDVLLGSYKRISQVLHLHSSQPKVTALYEDDSSDDDIIEVGDAPFNERKRSGDAVSVSIPRKNEVVELLDSDSDDDDVVVLEGPSSKKARAT